MEALSRLMTRDGEAKSSCVGLSVGAESNWRAAIEVGI